MKILEMTRAICIEEAWANDGVPYVLQCLARIYDLRWSPAAIYY